MSEMVKETLCSRCAHMNVCAYKQEYQDILKVPDGKIISKKVTNYDFIREISVGCKYYQNWTIPFHSGKIDS